LTPQFRKGLRCFYLYCRRIGHTCTLGTRAPYLTPAPCRRALAHSAAGPQLQALSRARWHQGRALRRVSLGAQPLYVRAAPQPNNPCRNVFAHGGY